MIPANEWWAVLQNYNLSVFPAQIVFYLLAVGMLVVFFTQPGEVANRVIKGYFVLAFGWTALVFFLLMGQKLPAHNAQAFLFGSLAMLFAADLVTNTSQFRLPEAGWRRVVMIGSLGVVLLYPVVGLLQGHPASKLIVPGTFPCPTTALALIFMASTLPEKRRWLYLVTLGLLSVWAIPFPIMIQIPQFGVYEDAIMLAMGLYALVMLVVNWQTVRQASLAQSPA